MIELDSAELKACCAAGYSSDLVKLLLGESYHPGGLALTRRLLSAVGLSAGEHVIDIASGIGTTAVLAAVAHQAQVTGVDLSAVNVERAQQAAEAAGVAALVRFKLGDAEALPVPDAVAQVVVCECALCTFPDKTRAAAEMARVLVPGGRVALTDVAAQPERLPPELTGLTAWVACIADARPASEYAALLTAAGLIVDTVESHTEALTRMIDQIEARIGLLKMTMREQAEGLGLDFTRVAPVLAATRTAVADGVLDYVLLTATKPTKP